MVPRRPNTQTSPGAQFEISRVPCAMKADTLVGCTRQPSHAKVRLPQRISVIGT